MAFACKTAALGPELQVSLGPRPHLWFFAFKTKWLASEILVSMVPALICVFCMQNSDFWIRINSLYGCQPSSVVFACKTATLGQGLQVTVGPRPYLWFFAFKTATLAPELQISIGLSLHLWLCAFKTASFAAEILVSMGPWPQLSFCACKTTRIASE